VKVRVGVSVGVPVAVRVGVALTAVGVRVAVGTGTPAVAVRVGVRSRVAATRKLSVLQEGCENVESWQTQTLYSPFRESPNPPTRAHNW
jgi:hypothetical protein